MFQKGDSFLWVSDEEETKKIELYVEEQAYERAGKQGLIVRDKKTKRKYFAKVIYSEKPDVFVEKESKVKMYSPFIVRIYGGMFYEEKSCFITLIEYIEQPDLSDLIRHSSPLGKTKEETMKIKHKIALKILYGVSHYLSMYEEDPVVHRDLKPENIMASKDGEIVKIIDFDWAHLHESNVTILTQRKQRGTPGYAEPQAWNSHECTPLMDIYSLGLVFYFLYMEKHHFYHRKEIETYLLGEEYAYTLKNTPGLPAKLRAILEKMIAKREDRYESIDSVISDFRAYVKGEGYEDTLDELLMEQPSTKMQFSYKIGSIKYSPMVKNYHFIPICIGSKQERSKNGTINAHIVSFYRVDDAIKCAILDPVCKKISKKATAPILYDGAILPKEQNMTLNPGQSTDPSIERGTDKIIEQEEVNVGDQFVYGSIKTTITKIEKG